MWCEPWSFKGSCAILKLRWRLDGDILDDVSGSIKSVIRNGIESSTGKVRAAIS